MLCIWQRKVATQTSIDFFAELSKNKQLAVPIIYTLLWSEFNYRDALELRSLSVTYIITSLHHNSHNKKTLFQQTFSKISKFLNLH